jgi:hypothetical protein
LLLTVTLALGFAGCQSTPTEVNPKFGLATMTLLGTVKFDQGTNSIVGDAAIRFERPDRYEMVVTKGPTLTFCHVVSDGKNWKVEFPMQKRSLSGSETPGNEELALWIESRRAVSEAIERAQFADPFTETMHGEYKSGHLFKMELSEFRRVVGQILATRLRLTCQGCKSSLEIVIREVK